MQMCEKVETPNKNNWHHVLTDWEKMPWKWKVKLNESPGTNSQYGIKDCGGEGDCFFHCIAEILENQTFQDVRNDIAAFINDSNWSFYVDLYKAMKDVGDFMGQWDPHEISDAKAFREVIRTPGNKYWGDYITISIVQQIYEVNILIFETNLVGMKTEIKEYKTFSGDDYAYEDFILLHYYSDTHFQLIGRFDSEEKDMEIIFTKKTLPNKIKKLFGINQ